MLRRALAAAACVLCVLAARALGSNFTKGPYIQALTDTGVTVMWETDKVEPASVEWGPTGMLGRTIRTRGKASLAEVRVEGLEPATKYYYRVVEGDDASRIASFRTLPRTGAFTFVAYGDTRSDPVAHATMTMLIAGKEPAFVVHTGDLVADGSKPELWKTEFFDAVGPLMARTCLYTVPGNHEEESPLYYQYAGPRYLGDNTGLAWYSFDCVDAHFVMLDSCIDIAPGSPQYEWLVRDLSTTTKRWRFAVFHHPLYSSGAHGSSVELRETLEPVLRRYGIDMVFNGHDHHYERTLPVASSLEAPKPITYVVAGGGGAPLRRVAGDIFTAKAASVYNFCTVTIDGNVLGFTAFDGTGREIDRLRIVKAGQTLVNAYDVKPVSLEMIAARDAVRQALAAQEADTAAGPATVTYEFAAPAWSDLTLDIEWKAGEGGATVEPEKASLRIPAGKRQPRRSR